MKRPMHMLRFVESEGDGGSTPSAPIHNGQPSPTTNPEPAQTFTQADVDRVVKERVQRERAKYADYDALKAKAEGAKTLEDRLAEIEQRAAQAEAAALRSDIAAKFGISAEDRDLFLTGADEETLMAQAKRLSDREADRKKQGNTAPNEGGNPTAAPNATREFARNLFSRGD